MPLSSSSFFFASFVFALGLVNLTRVVLQDEKKSLIGSGVRIANFLANPGSRNKVLASLIG